VNFISGPGAGKSVMAAMIFIKLKLLGHSTELCQEYAKSLVWTKDWETLNNQYLVTQKQFNLLKNIEGKTSFVVCDGPIIHGLYYNLWNPDNTSDIQKTQNMIVNCHKQFENINIFLKRGQFAYEQAGRMQTKEEALSIDDTLQFLLEKNKIKFTIFDSSMEEENLLKIVTFILDSSRWGT